MNLPHFSHQIPSSSPISKPKKMNHTPMQTPIFRIDEIKIESSRIRRLNPGKKLWVRPGRKEGFPSWIPVKFRRHVRPISIRRGPTLRRSVHVSSAFPNCTCCTWGQVHTESGFGSVPNVWQTVPRHATPSPASKTDISRRVPARGKTHPSFQNPPRFVCSWKLYGTLRILENVPIYE